MAQAPTHSGRMRFGISLKFLLFIVVLLVIIATPLILYAQKTLQTSLLETQRSEAADIARQAISGLDRTNLPKAGSEQEKQALTTALQNVTEISAFRVNIWSAGGQLVASSSGRPANGQAAIDLIPLFTAGKEEAISPIDSRILVDPAYGRYIDIALPIRDNANRPRYAIELAWTVESQLRASNSLSAAVVAAMMAAFLSLCLGIYLLLYLAVLRPIQRLQTIARQLDLSQAPRDYRIRQRDEIGSLYDDFYKMHQNLYGAHADELRENYAKLEAEHALATQARRQLEASISGLSVGMLLVDHSGQPVLWNHSLTRMLHLETEPTFEHINTRLDNQVDLGEWLARLKKAKKMELKEIELEGNFLFLQATPIGADARSGMTLLIQDITEEKILERSKDEFFSIASHELRTPLTSIKGNASMVMSYYADQLKNKDLKEMVSDIHESSNRLIDIVNDFLDVSRLEQGRVVLTPEAFALADVIEHVHYEMKTLLHDRGLHFKIDTASLKQLPLVWGDKNRVEQVVYNLIGNAVKFTDKGGITIEVIRHDGHLKVLVSDTGRGMTLESQKLLFHKFQQASSSLLTRDTTKGTGLGLYISKMLVEQMGGKIALERSEADKGTTFSFTLPIATEKLKAESAKLTAKTDAATGMTTAGSGQAPAA